MNKLVVEKLGNLSREQLANVTSRELFTLLHEAQEEMGVWHYRRDLSWACSRWKEAMEKHRPSASSRLDDTRNIILVLISNVFITLDYAIPDRLATFPTLSK